jgi:hypothetical protein
VEIGFNAGLVKKIGFELSFGYSHGWGSGESSTRTVKHTAIEKVPPRSKVKVKIFVISTSISRVFAVRVTKKIGVFAYF